MVNRIYPPELSKANSTYTEAPYLELTLSISNDTIFTKIYDQRDDFDFDNVNFRFRDVTVLVRTSYGIYYIK